MEREERRKRIVQRGSDRLALITGRIQNLESPLSPSHPESTHHFYSHSRSQSAPVAMNFNNDLSFSPDQDQYHKSPPQPNLREEMQNSAATYKNEAQFSAVDTRVTKASDDAEMLHKSTGGHGTLLTYFTPKRINSCIISSEDTRVFCSIMIALLVVIAYANLPRHIVKSKSLIASRPLYVLLLTDAMIVVLRITSSVKHRGSGVMNNEKKRARNMKAAGGNNIWDEAIKVLEWGLVLYQTVRAVFIDCSFYIVIIICGFSFM